MPSTAIHIQQTIDRTSDEPAYLQLANILQKEISLGTYRSGDRLPSESQLRKRYKVSPMTVRRAINTLIEKDVVRTSQGLGTFVSSLKMHKVTFGLDGFYNVLNEGGPTLVKILEAGIIKADETIAGLLDTAVESNAIHIRRLLIKDEEPLIYHREFLIYDPRRPIVEGELKVASLLDLFSGSNESDLKWGEFKIIASVLTKENAEALNSVPGHPAFHIEHTFYDYNDRRISWGVFICRGDKFQFNTTIGRAMGKDTGHPAKKKRAATV
jgi:GntR family transcriptional regulator